MPATSRLIVMMDPKEKADLEARAEAEQVSTAEFVRRRLFGRAAPEERAFLEMLAELKPLVRRAVRTIDANLADIRALRTSRPESDVAASDRARAELTSEEIAAVAAHLQLGALPSGLARRGTRR